MGQGPLTGRGMGPCNYRGRRFLTKKEELESLKEEELALKEDLMAVRERIEEIEK